MATLNTGRTPGGVNLTDNPQKAAVGAVNPAVRLTPETYTTIGDLVGSYAKPDNRELLIKTYGDQGITGFLKLTGAVITKQRLRWDKSIIRFRVRKHKDVYFPHQGFSWSNFFALFENVFYNVVLDFTWWVYIIDMTINYSSSLDFIIYMNLTLYFCVGFVQMMSIYIFSERRKEELYLWRYLPLMSLYTGLYLRIVRSRAYIDEWFFRKSYDDPWNPVKSSSQAKANGF